MRAWGAALGLALATAALLSSSAAAQGGAKAFRCAFDVGAITRFVDGASFRTADAGSLGELIFSINDDGSARIIGNQGASNIPFLDLGNALHFIEATGVGYMNVTTIFLLRTGDGRLLAVHSRHLAILDDYLVSQYNGTCQLLN